MEAVIYQFIMLINFFSSPSFSHGFSPSLPVKKQLWQPPWQFS